MEEMRPPLLSPPKTSTSSRLFRLLAIALSICLLLYFVTSLSLVWTNSDIRSFLASSSRLSAPASLDKVVFGLASTSGSWPKHKEYLKLWWDPHRKMRGCVFVDTLPAENSSSDGLPPICVSQDTSQFRYTYKHGYRSYIRVARIVSEVVNLSLLNDYDDDDVRWYVFGDGDTIFFPENLVKTLSKYDHEMWYYVGTNSEVYEQNRANSFDMGFWGAGFALSAPLARVLAKVFDSCLVRYQHLYGGDGRVYSCLAELGVGLTREPGFHQVDVRGDIFGLLTSHPMTPLVSLSHLSEVAPIFPRLTALDALRHLFEAAKIDSERILQQTVCYDRWFYWTISVSWGYAVEVFDRHIHLPDALQVQDTFIPRNYTFSTRPLHPDPCRRSTIFYFDRGYAGRTRITTNYKRVLPDNCTFDPMASPKKLEEIVVFSRKSNLGINQLRAPRRQCCDILTSSSSRKLELSIRECGEDELIRIHA